MLLLLLLRERDFCVSPPPCRFIFYFSLYPCFCTWGYVRYWHAVTSTGQKRGSGPLALELQALWATLWVHGSQHGARRAAPSHWTILPSPQMKSSHGKCKSQSEIPISECRQKRMIKYLKFRIICVIAPVGSQVQPLPFLSLFCLQFDERLHLPVLASQELHIWISVYRRNRNRLLSDLMWWACGSSMIEPMLTIPEVLGSNPSKKMKEEKNKRLIHR